jgi:hypothetical protein
MNHSMQPIMQHLFQASTLEDISRERLESFVEEYPCFGLGHYLLSRKLRAESAGHYLEETHRTSLYFSNPFWLHWLLENTSDTGDKKEDAGSAGLATMVAPASEPVMAVASEPVTAEPQHEASAQSPATEWAAPPEEEIQPVHEEPAIAGTDDEGQAAPHPAEEEQAIISPAGEEQAAPHPAEEEHQTSEPELSAAELLLNSIEEARVLRESLLKLNEDFQTAHTEDPIHDEEPPFILEEETPPVSSDGAIADAPVSDGPTVDVPPAGMTAVAEEPWQSQPVAEEPQQAEPPSVVHLQAPEPSAEASGDLPQAMPAPPTTHAPQPAEAHTITKAEPELVFEPFHTIDYFASQGIKLRLDENPSDSLGKQLKSFTDWLKVMRKLPQKEREIVPDRVTEQTIQSIAAHSIEGKEVVTETMAEVLAKQGMPERARILYEKLSLLNPEKRAYFAAKIEQLKSH